MPTLVFLENDKEGADVRPLLVETGNVVSTSSLPTVVSFETLMALTKRELLTIMPSTAPVRKSSSKDVIAGHLIEHWQLVVKEVSTKQGFASGFEPPSSSSSFIPTLRVRSDEPDDGDEPSEPDDDGGEPSEGGDSNQSSFLTVFAKFQEQTLQFGFNEGNTSVSNLTFRASGKLGLPWFQLSVQVEGHQLDDFEDLFDYTTEIANETLGFVVYVELFHYDTERPQNIVNVIVMEQYGERRQFNLELLSSTLYLNIKDFVMDYLSELLELHHHDIILRYNNDELECAPLGSHPASAQELMMEVSIVGKGGVISHHRAEALEDLKKKVIKNIKKTKTPTDATFPEAFTTYVESVKRKTQDIVFMKTQGIRVVDAGLRALSDEQLETVRDIMDIKKGRRGTSEERVQKAVCSMFPVYKEIDSAIASLRLVQEEMMETMVTTYADEFHNYSAGVMTLSNDTFISEIDSEIRSRRRQREMSNQLSEGGNNPANASGCAIA